MPKSRLKAGVTLAATMAVGTVLLASPASATRFPVVGTMENMGNGGFCLTIDGGSSVRGAPARTWNCDGHPSRLWELESASGRIINYSSKKCLTVDGGSAAEGARIVQWDCDGHKARYWYILRDIRYLNTYEIENQYTRKCLSISGTSFNAWAVQYTCGTPLQRIWRLPANG